MLNRRDWIKIGAGAFAASQLPLLGRAASTSPKKILVLGGTGFLGPHVVQRAIDRGHLVTLFNRGDSGKDLFPQVEKIRGDRQPGDNGDLSGLNNSRTWDAVIDVWANDPEVVMPIAKLLADRTAYYYFVSSIAAYNEFSKVGMDETSPTRLEKPGYGGNKARSEKGLQELFGNRVGINRAHAIVGPGDTSVTYYYWLSQLLKDEEIIGPGTGDDDFVQYVDVRDVANWIIDSVEQRRPGPFNICSAPQPFRVFLKESSAGIGGKARVVWIDNEFLRTEQHLRTFNDLPFWNFDRPGFEQISNAKARAAGFVSRPLAETARVAWASYLKIMPSGLTFPYSQYGDTHGISDERQKEILAAWKQKTAATRKS